ncbi:MAG: DUF3365 domain-containing protein [Cyclobacteriaceae bacterium]
MCRKNYILMGYILLVFIVGSCNLKTHQNESSPDAEVNYVALGDSISVAAQQALMKQLMMAMEAGGPEHAVNFCSERAIPITDSLSNKYNCEIKRVALRNRNPDNQLTEGDKKVFDEFDEAIAKGAALSPQLVEQQEAMLFYKPIVLGMPACLQCHGKPDDLSVNALAAIQAKYPDDKALDFSMGELRGMWRITFNRKPQ